ncbi:MAG: RecB-family nuclease [Desulfurococcales archaeon]|nr:RecB-family nuclease [Desulfurococcales archaeon]
MELIPVLHNVSSVQRLADMAKLVYAFGIDTLVVSKAYGGAAQSGIPEAYRIALKHDKRLIVLPDLNDVVDLLKPDDILIITYSHARERIDPINPPVYNGRITIIFNGSEPDFSASEASIGKPIYFAGIKHRLGALGEAALILYGLTLRSGGRESGSI